MSKLYIIGSGLEVEEGLAPCEDYSNSKCNDGFSCSNIPQRILSIYKCLTKELRYKSNNIILATSPRCLFRCIDVEPRIRRRIYQFTNCITCKDCVWDFGKQEISRSIMQRLLKDLIDIDEIIILGTQPYITPAALIPLIGKYYGKRLVVIISKYNNYTDIADEVVVSTAIKYLEEYCEKIKNITREP